jgi:Mce-associated membrane protein
MPPPRRRRPVQPATRVRIPRAVRSRGIPSGGESAGGPLPVAGAPGTDLSPDDLAHDNVTGPAPAAETQTRDEPAAGETLTGDESAADEPAQDKPGADEPTESKQAADEPAAAGAQTAARHPLVLPGCLGALAVILGGLAVWFGLEASSATSGVDTANTALTNSAATRQVTQQVTSAVNQIFSYNYADTAKTSQAAAAVLTGQAKSQYNTLFKLVRLDAPKEKLVVTTTVTNSGVEFLDGNRARLLIFTDQRDTSGTTHNTTDAGAMFAVNAVNQGGRWKISSIDTFSHPG